MKFSVPAVLGLLATARAAPTDQVTPISERSNPCDWSGGHLVYSTKSRHLCIGHWTLVTAGVVIVGGWVAPRIIDALMSKGCSTQNLELPTRSTESGPPFNNASVTSVQIDHLSREDDLDFQHFETTEDGSRWEMAQNPGEEVIFKYYPSSSVVEGNVRRSSQAYYSFSWSKSGRNHCSTKLSKNDLADLINNHAMRDIVNGRRECAIYYIDNSGTFHGTLKTAFCRGGHCYDYCWKY